MITAWCITALLLVLLIVRDDHARGWRRRYAGLRAAVDSRHPSIVGRVNSFTSRNN